MTPNDIDASLEGWEREVLAGHRWGRCGERASEERARLRKLWEAGQPLSPSGRTILGQIVALEICNWNLEESVVALCAAIGSGEPVAFAIGHGGSISEQRWKQVWAYYLRLREWLVEARAAGLEALLTSCDPDGAVRQHVLRLLGHPSELKQLYVERFCLCLEFWLGGLHGRDSADAVAHRAAVRAVEDRIRKHDAAAPILRAFQHEGDGRLQPCHHKAFRRYDIILSSIGTGKWRGGMPTRGTDGLERAQALEELLTPIETWIAAPAKAQRHGKDELFDRIQASLGELDAGKRFLASLLVSLLRAQQLAAKELAERRAETPTEKKGN